ncbi:META domain-containing protein [Rhizobium sp. TRM95111]|uniref:META domain-containing protein n=1 Tax=Rhizobium alarense TaxID=2846851 RepID=UPI001F32C3DD|nr:META domain-containing protein [Rhizobium alarense]MCF3639429.1 META domain-containing protein [Rhizobium alarense]
MFRSTAVLAAIVTLSCCSAAAAQTQVPVGLGGAWQAQDIGGNAVIENLQTTLDIREDGTYGGNGGCNTYRGNLKVEENGLITFAPAAATRKMCAPAIMDQEQKFFDALGTVKSWRLENGTLQLADKDGGHVIRLSVLNRGTEITLRLPQTAAVDRQTVNYGCDDGANFAVEYINAGAVSLAVLTIGDASIVTSSVIAGSGAKYAGGKYEWWTKGDEATLYDLTRGETAPGVLCRKAS